MSSAADRRQLTPPTRRVITLVHGTWAVDAPWTGPQSKLSTTLARQLPGTRFEIGKWSGLNSHAARKGGGANLRQQLSEAIERTEPDVAHYLIAHSHGGNVVRRALRGLPREHKARLRGAVCLATPFITVERRPLGERLQSFRDLVHNKGLFLLGAALLLAPVLELLVVDRGWPLKMLGALLLSGYVVIWFGETWRTRLLSWLERTLPRLRARALLDLRTAAPPNPPLLAIEPEFDEPGLWLRQVQRVADLPFRVRRWFIRSCAVGGALTALWIAVARPAIAAGGLGTLWADGIYFDPLFMWVLTGGIGATVGGAVGFTLAELGRWLIPTAVKSRNYGFGVAPWYFNYLTDIRVDRPPAEFEDAIIEKIRVKRQGLGLRHSAIYGNDEVLERIVRFIEACETALVTDDPSSAPPG